MANEIGINYIPNLNLYLVRFQLNGDVFVTNGSSDEVWGAGGNDADDYDVTMSEKGNSGHYVGTFDTSANIAAGTYRIAVYVRKAASAADADQPAIFQGVAYWDGDSSENVGTINDDVELILADTDEIQGKLPDDYIMGSSVTTSMDDEIDTIKANSGQVHTTEDESPGGGGGSPTTTSGIAEGC